MRELAAAATLALWSAAAAAQFLELRWADPALNWRTLRSEHFDVHFAGQYRSQARLAAAMAEKVYTHTTALVRWQPRERVHIVLLDSADFANGFATPVPFNLSGIFLAPPDEGELLQNREWLELVLSHELYHIVHLDKASGTPLSLRGIFGRFLPLFPNVLQPTWIVEGVAVDAESDAASGYGRLGHSHFEGMMRAEVGRGLRSLHEVNARGRGFPLNRDYLYGSYFFAFLRERYGERTVAAFIDGYSANMVPFKVQSNAALATGRQMDALWLDYQAWLRARFAPRANVQQGELMARAFSIGAPTLAPSGTRWYVEADGYTRPKLVRQQPGGPVRAVRETERDTRLAAWGEDRVLMSEHEICRNHHLLYDVHEVDARGSRRRISSCARYRFAAPLGDGRIAAVRVEGGAGEVVVLERGAVAATLYRARTGESLTGLAAKGERVVVTSLRDGRWALLELGAGGAAVLVSDGAVKHSPRFADNTDEIFFVADYDKVYDVWSWRQGAGALLRWTRAAHGVREISAPVRGEMLLVTLEADGDALRLLRLPQAALGQRPISREVAPPEQPAPAVVLAAEEAPYSPWPSLRPTSWLPLAQIGDGAIALGALTYGTDALQMHEYLAAPMIELRQGELLGRLQYAYAGRHGVLLDRNLTVRSSEDDRVRTYTIRQSAQWVSLWRELALNRRLYWGLGAALEQEDLHDVAAGSTRTQNERVLGFVAGIDSRRAQWLSEGPSQGQSLRLFAETSRGLGAAFDGNAYRADWRVHIPLRRTVLALRWNEAYAQRAAEPFELGGSKSDEMDLLPVLNQRDLPLRGYGTGTPALIGRRARTLSAEWRLPLADVDRHLVVPPVGMKRIALGLFVDAGAAWERGSAADYHRGFGAELLSEPRFGYVFGLQLRAGVARGVDEGGSTRVYLRAGRSF